MKKYGLFSRNISSGDGTYDFSSPNAREETISALCENASLARSRTDVYWRKMKRYYDGAHDINHITGGFLDEVEIPWTPAQSNDGFVHVESQIESDTPDFEFSPVGSYSAESAKMREEAVRRVCFINNLPELNIKSERRLGIYGSSVWKAAWGENGGREEVIVSTPSPEQIFTDPAADTVDDCEYIAYIYSMHAQKARRTFGGYIEALGESFESYLSCGGEKSVVFEGDYDDENTVTVTEFWFRQPKDSEANSKERYFSGDIALCVLLNGREVSYIPKYWKNTGCRMFPFVISNRIPNDGSIWGKSELEMLIPLIDAADRELTFAQLNSAFTSNDIILAEENAFADGEIPDNSPGAVWKLRPGMMGKVQRLGNMSASAQSQFSNYALWQNMMEQTTGNFDVNQGKEPSRVTTASGIALMNERSSSRQNRKKAGRNEGFRRLYTLIDRTVGEFYEDGREIVCSGGCVNYDKSRVEECGHIPPLDVKIHIGDGVANSKAFTVSAVSALMNADINAENYKFVKAYVDLIGIPMRNEICEYLERRFSDGSDGADDSDTAGILAEAVLEAQENCGVKDIFGGNENE